MAAKTKNENASGEMMEATPEAVEDATEVIVEPEVKKPTKVMVKLPLLRDQNANQDVFVSVNFKNYIIRRGVFVEIPEEVAEVLKNSEQAEEAAWKYAVENKLREA